ncbi:hypothetical protein [Streptomyces malaysiensis]|uniref:hypothetical protein n=1 Tax=Streptomyces malaysiensis TaxID=92644 RepID=UPI002B2FDF84|nr:hypothetical protein R8789_27645 [Streptomyces malaysiensis]
MTTCQEPSLLLGVELPDPDTLTRAPTARLGLCPAREAAVRRNPALLVLTVYLCFAGGPTP